MIRITKLTAKESVLEFCRRDDIFTLYDKSDGPSVLAAPSCSNADLPDVSGAIARFSTLYGSVLGKSRISGGRTRITRIYCSWRIINKISEIHIYNPKYNYHLRIRLEGLQAIQRKGNK